MNTVKLGYEWEKRAEDVLAQLGFTVIESCKNLGNNSPYDILVKKGDKTYAVNVKYGTKGFTITAVNLQRLMNLNDPIPVLLFINEHGYVLTEVTQSTIITNIKSKHLMAVKITKQLCDGYEQRRITIPAQLIRSLGWKTGDELDHKVHKGGILFRKVED